MDVVLARRMLLFSILLFLLAAMLGSAISRDPAREAEAPPRESPPAAAPPQVDGELPADKVVRARVGDLVTITVRPKQADTVFLEGLGVDGDASPEVPGQLELVAERAGEFRAVGEATGERLGMLVVEPATG